MAQKFSSTNLFFKLNLVPFSTAALEGRAKFYRTRKYRDILRTGTVSKIREAVHQLHDISISILFVTPSVFFIWFLTYASGRLFYMGLS